MLVLQPLKYRFSDAASAHDAPRNGGASVSGAAGVFEAHRALSKSLAVYHRDQMLANAVSQRAAWVLVLQPLKYRLSDAASAHDAPRNGGASVSGEYGVH